MDTTAAPRTPLVQESALLQGRTLIHCCSRNPWSPKKTRPPLTRTSARRPFALVVGPRRIRVYFRCVPHGTDRDVPTTGFCEDPQSTAGMSMCVPAWDCALLPSSFSCLPYGGTAEGGEDKDRRVRAGAGTHKHVCGHLA